MPMSKDAQKDFYDALGFEIERQRKRKGTTRYGLARAADQQIGTVTRIENGKSCLVHQLLWLREQLGVSADELLNRALKRARNKGMDDVREETKEIEGSDFI